MCENTPRKTRQANLTGYFDKKELPPDSTCPPSTSPPIPSSSDTNVRKSSKRKLNDSFPSTNTKKVKKMPVEKIKAGEEPTDLEIYKKEIMDLLKTHATTLQTQVKTITKPLEDRQDASDARVDAIETRMAEQAQILSQLQTSSQEYMAKQTTINDRIMEVQQAQAIQLKENTPDPSTALLRSKLLEAVQREGCALIVSNGTTTETGTTGWSTILNSIAFRPNFTKVPFSLGTLKHRTNSDGKVISTVTFENRATRDLFHKAVEKKGATTKFFLSYPIEYRAANKHFRARAALLREAGFSTDISIDEGSLIMYLKYRERAVGKTPYEYVISEKFDPFDKNDTNALVTKPSRVLNKTSIMIRPNYGDNHSEDSLRTFITKFDEEMIQLETPLPKFTYIVTRVIMMQFASEDKTSRALSLLTEQKTKMIAANFLSVVL